MLTTDDLVKGDNCFFAATGITDGELLRGVHFDSKGASHAVAGPAVKSGTVGAWRFSTAFEAGEFRVVDFHYALLAAEATSFWSPAGYQK